MTAEHVSTNHTPADQAALRADIAQVRAELSATVGALAERVDVKARTQEAVRQARAELAVRAHTVADQARERAALIGAVAALAGLATAAGLVVRARMQRTRLQRTRMRIGRAGKARMGRGWRR